MGTDVLNIWCTPFVEHWKPIDGVTFPWTTSFNYWNIYMFDWSHIRRDPHHSSINAGVVEMKLWHKRARSGLEWILTTLDNLLRMMITMHLYLYVHVWYIGFYLNLSYLKFIPRWCRLLVDGSMELATLMQGTDERISLLDRYPYVIAISYRRNTVNQSIIHWMKLISMGSATPWIGIDIS